MNQPATFTVAVSGGVAPYQYQWKKDGALIGGATSNSYVTPAVALSDNNETFIVTVADSSGQIISNPATLTVGPRSPNPADLRFQQVAAPSTVNGYSNTGGIGTRVYSGIDFGTSAGIGTPLSIGQANCAPDFLDGAGGCFFSIIVFGLPPGPNLATDYVTGELDQFDSTISLQAIPLADTLRDPTTVVTSLQTSSAANAFGIAYMRTKDTTGFQMERHFVDPALISSAAAEEGARSRVITAISFNGGQVEYYSYGWTEDPSTLYETKVEAASFETVPAVAQGLASQGYIVTAFGGGGNATDAFLLVGTRVQGDTLPRPLRVSPFGQQDTLLWQPGYATVIALSGTDNYTTTYIGER